MRGLSGWCTRPARGAAGQVVDGDEDDVVTVEDRDRRTGRVNDAPAGHEREDLVDGPYGLAAGDRRPDGVRGGRAGRRPLMGWTRGTRPPARRRDPRRIRWSCRRGDAMGYGERPLVVGEHCAGGEIGFVDGQPVAGRANVALTQCPVRVEGLDLLEVSLVGGIAGADAATSRLSAGPSVVRMNPMRSSPPPHRPGHSSEPASDPRR